MDYAPWHLEIDRSHLVPANLAAQAAKVVILITPDLPRHLRRRECELMTIDLVPAAPRHIIDEKDEAFRIAKKAKRLRRLRRRSPQRLLRLRKNRNFAVDMQSEAEKIDLAQIVADAIERHSLLTPGDKVVVAVSGGADSVALLSVMNELGYDCLAAHCNFHLRGEESRRDMLHTQEICSRLGIDLAVKDFDVDKRRAETGESVEMACRALRYEWFDSLLTRERARAVAVGHHREDQVETVLLNLLRGTGIAGLSGMKYRRDSVIRPLLDCSRDQIEAYLVSRGLDFVCDSSNASDAHLRNRIRNKVMPLLSGLFPGAEDAVLTTAANLEAARRIYDTKINDYRREYTNSDGSVDVGRLAEDLPDDAVTILRELLKDTGLTVSQCRDIIASASASGLHFESGGVTVAELDRGVLSFPHNVKIRPADVYDVDLSRDVLTPINLRVSRHDIGEFDPGRDPSVLYLDESAALDDHRWQLRHPRRGDRIRPFGMKGSRLLSDLYSDAKYSAADKRNAWVLTCDDTVVWVVGLRASSLFPVTPETRHYLKIQYKPHRY